MNDEHAAATRFLQHLVHARDHLAFASHGIQAVMRVPHVADDDGCLLGHPGLLLGDDLELAVLLNARAKGEREFALVGIERQGNEADGCEADSNHWKHPVVHVEWHCPRTRDEFQSFAFTNPVFGSISNPSFSFAST